LAVNAYARFVKGATLKIYPGGDHGLAATHKDQLNVDLLACQVPGSELRPPPGEAMAAQHLLKQEEERRLPGSLLGPCA
jgi:hypothetical protein